MHHLHLVEVAGVVVAVVVVCAAIWAIRRRRGAPEAPPATKTTCVRIIRDRSELIDAIERARRFERKAATRASARVARYESMVRGAGAGTPAVPAAEPAHAIEPRRQPELDSRRRHELDGRAWLVDGADWPAIGTGVPEDGTLNGPSDLSGGAPAPPA